VSGSILQDDPAAISVTLPVRDFPPPLGVAGGAGRGNRQAFHQDFLGRIVVAVVLRTTLGTDPSSVLPLTLGLHIS